MTNMMRNLKLAGVVSALLLSACNFDKNAVQDIAGAPAASAIRFFNFGPNAPSVNFYANDTKMTAVLSATGAEATTGVAYGAVGSNGFYDAIAPGQYTLTGKISAATDKDLAISSVSTAIADGKYYSYYISGFYDGTAKKAEAFVVEDPLPAANDYSAAFVRFVNAISNSQPMVLSAKNTTSGAVTALGTAVSYKSAGAFTALPEGSYDLSARVAGASTDAIARAGVSFSRGRVYTISSRGDITITSTTATNRPFLDNTANR